ncbi:MAG: protease inhibitor I42 family protein [Pseudomonadota bacterium]
MYRLYLLGLLLLYSAIGSANEDPLLLTEKDCGKTFLWRSNIEIRLKALPSAGYNWYLMDGIPEVFIKERNTNSQNSRSGASKLGAKAETIFLIEIKKEIDTTLVFEYKRPWENEVIKTCSLHLNKNITGDR